MKHLVSYLLVVAGVVGSLRATPDRSITVTERLFGSNDTGYAVIRTEDDNQCSYYHNNVKTWLDEYASDDIQRKKVKSTLLLEVSHSRNTDSEDPGNPAKGFQTVASRDASLTLADVILRYPQRETVPWTAEQTAEISASPIAGISFRDHKIFIYDGGAISRDLFGGRNSDVDWKLDQVFGDSNCYYLQLHCGEDENQESRLLCVPPAVSKQIRDQFTLQPIYLVAGTFDSLAAAQTRARELRDKARELKFHDFNPEIWSSLPPTDKIVWHVAEQYSTQMIRGSRIPATEAALGIHLTPVSSERFIERFDLGK